MTAYARGAQRERAVQDQLEARGWVVTRAAGSKVLDLHATKDGATWLIEVKGTSASPFSDFGPDKREALKECAERAGASAWLCWWPPRKDARWYPVEGWPQSP